VLSVVPTPIGNLGDISMRALETLRACDLVAAEDTRHSGLLLKHHGIKKPFVSLHEHNEASRTASLVPRILDGLHVAMVTDAGTPGLSDPGARLIRGCIEAGAPVSVLPGASAITTALVGSGFTADSGFFFGGFLPNTSGRRERTLRGALESGHVCLFFESPHRLLKSLGVLAALDPERPLCVARELTKRFENYHRGTAPVLLDHFSKTPPRGEICLVIAAKATRHTSLPLAADPAPIEDAGTMIKDIGRILYHESTILTRLDELAATITRDYSGRPLTVVGILNGSCLFLGDLLRRIPIPLQVDCLSVASYHGGTRSSGTVTFRQTSLPDVAGRDVLVVDDILDTGRTLAAVCRILSRDGRAAGVRSCVLLDKDIPRAEPVEPDYLGFKIANEFVVGYGLDYMGQYRNLPFIGVLTPEAIARTENTMHGPLTADHADSNG
jgi:16S rRNA (cytidine1402-2'-O)-methyltransferase